MATFLHVLTSHGSQREKFNKRHELIDTSPSMLTFCISLLVWIDMLQIEYRSDESWQNFEALRTLPSSWKPDLKESEWKEIAQQISSRTNFNSHQFFLYISWNANINGTMYEEHRFPTTRTWRSSLFIFRCLRMGTVWKELQFPVFWYQNCSKDSFTKSKTSLKCSFWGR